MDNLIPPGPYSAVCTNACLNETQGGKPQVCLTFSITSEGEMLGRQITYYKVFHTEPTFRMVTEALRNCGWQGMNLMDLSSCVYGTGGKEVTIVVDIEEPNEYRKTQRNVVNWVNSGGGAAIKNQLTGDKLATVAKRFEALFMKAAQSDPDLAPQETEGEAPPLKKQSGGLDPADFGLDPNDIGIPF